MKRSQMLAIACLTLGAAPCVAVEATAVVDRTSTLIRGESYALDLGIAGWGPNWAWMGWGGEVQANGEVSEGSFSASYTAAPSPTTLGIRIEKTGPSQLSYRYQVAAEQSQDYTMIALTIDPGRDWVGTVRATNAAGISSETPWPVGTAGLGTAIQRIELVGAAGSTVFQFDPALDVSSHGALRVQLATHLEGGIAKDITMAVDLPQPVAFYPSIATFPGEADKEDWFEWKPNYDYSPESALSMDGWSSGKAGSAGRIGRDGDSLVYGDQPFRAWGLNLCFNAGCAPSKEIADKRAAFYAANGINAVRLHKFADGSGWAGILKAGSTTEYDPVALDRMDYFVAQLIERGIFVKLSASFGSLSIARDAYDSIPYAGEWGERPAANGRLQTGSGAVFLSRELQDLHIEQMVALLNHTNPYTGSSYAADPGIMLVEMVNEESALFYGTLGQLQKSPTLRRRAGERFAAWLIERYGSAEAVEERWGPGIVGSFSHEGLSDESFAEGVIYPIGNPWFWDPTNINGSQLYRAPRLYDTALFLAELQNDFYDRFHAAVTASGYDGLMMASNWQAGRGSSHFYNLHSDARFDVVDRHNYFSGGGSMLQVPGGGSLSTGMQQVAERPFSLSEWIHVFPNQWGAEGPAIIGAYGLGLQGWDISFMFQNSDEGAYRTVLGQQWDVVAPHVFAPFPAIARHVRRGDIAVSEVVATLNVHHDSLHSGDIGFIDETAQNHDVKAFGSDKVPSQTLAVARTAVKFVDEPTPTEAFDIEAHRDDSGALVSTTGELRWMPGASAESGWFSIDTAATKAVVGFADGTTHQLGTVTIAPASRFGMVYVTAVDKAGSIADDNRLLIVASARAHNDGMKYLDGRLLERGVAPILMEPVVATITLGRPGTPTVFVCDHDGQRTDQTLPIHNGSFTIDGRESKTIYYEVVYPDDPTPTPQRRKIRIRVHGAVDNPMPFDATITPTSGAPAYESAEGERVFPGLDPMATYTIAIEPMTVSISAAPSPMQREQLALDGLAVAHINRFFSSVAANP